MALALGVARTRVVIAVCVASPKVAVVICGAADDVGGKVGEVTAITVIVTSGGVTTFGVNAVIETVDNGMGSMVGCSVEGAIVEITLFSVLQPLPRARAVRSSTM